MEVNTRVNYPIKNVLIEMAEEGDIVIDDPMCQFCVSWYTIHVANIGNGLFVSSWNEHPIPCESFSILCMHVTTT